MNDQTEDNVYIPQINISPAEQADETENRSEYAVVPYESMIENIYRDSLSSNREALCIMWTTHKLSANSVRPLFEKPLGIQHEAPLLDVLCEEFVSYIQKNVNLIHDNSYNKHIISSF